MFNLLTFFVLLILGIMASAANGDTAAGQVTTIYEYNDETFIENFTILPDGRLLFCALTGAELLIIDPRDANPTPTSIVTFPGVDSVGAVALVGPNEYAVIGGNHTFFSFIEGSMKVFVVSLDTTLGPGQAIGATVSNIISVPDTTMMNGIVSLPNKRHIILSQDSIRGRLFRVDTRTGEAIVASEDPAFGRGGNEEVPLGANGVDIRDGYMYFTNSAQGRFFRVHLDDNGYPIGEFETVAQLDGPVTLANAYDDFAFDNDGNAYVTLHPASVMKITPGGKQTLFAGGGSNSIFRHPTSAVLANEGDAIYVSTGGDWENEVAGGGQLIKIMLRKTGC